MDAPKEQPLAAPERAPSVSEKEAYTKASTTMPEAAVSASAHDSDVEKAAEPPKPAAANPNDPSTIPNGGTKAWLQVLGAFFLFFNSWGIINAFGIYQTYYETTMLPATVPAAISWVGTVQGFCLIMIGPLTGPIYDAGHFRLLIVTGTFLIVFGHMMLSLCSEYWQVLLAQAFVIGIGAGCLYIPSVAILATYFSSNLPVAMGLAAAGSSIGGVLYPVILYRILPVVGFGWATRILGFIALATLTISNLTMKVRVLPPAKRKIVDLSAFAELPYSLFVAGVFCAFTTFFAPYFYVEYFSLTYNIADESLSFYTLAILNAASTAGRLVPNYLAQKIGPMNVIVPFCAIAGILTFCLIPVRNTAPLVVLCILYGFFSGAIVSLPPTIFVHLSMHKRHLIGTRMGMGFAVCSIGVLIGMPICGWILDGSSFTYVWVFGGLFLIAGSALIGASRVAKVGSSKLLVVA